MPESPWYWLLYLAIAFLLPRIPVVGKFFNIINTALHELGHAIVALCAGGQVNKIELFKDTSGTTTTRTDGRFSAVLTSLAGYPFAASVAWLSFYLIERGAAQGLVVGLTVLFFVMLLFWIRNPYGVLWVFLFCGVNICLFYFGGEEYVPYAALFYAMMILVESVTSSLVLLVLTVRDPQKAGDATNLAKITHVPAFVWGLLFAAYTGWVVYKVVEMLFL
jgi:hypothetical protein